MNIIIKIRFNTCTEYNSDINYVVIFVFYGSDGRCRDLPLDRML
jgi:hypothetical protein